MFTHCNTILTSFPLCPHSNLRECNICWCSLGGCCLGDATFGGAPWLVKYLGVQLGGAPSDTGAAPPSHPLTLGGAPPFAPPLHPLQTGAAPPGFGGAPPLHPPAPSKVLDFGILPMYLSFQVHLWSSVLWMLEEYYSLYFQYFPHRTAFNPIHPDLRQYTAILSSLIHP